MKNNVKQSLNHAVDMALADGFSLNKYFCLTDKDGYYMSADVFSKSCHPLEAIIVGSKIERYVNEEIAHALNVSPQWVDGFLDGYGGYDPDPRYRLLRRDHPDYNSYVEGYYDGNGYQETVGTLENAHRIPF